jgi:hypothetical protein
VHDKGFSFNLLPLRACRLGLRPQTFYLFRGDKNPEFFERRVILNKPEGSFISANYIGAAALAPAFFTIIFFCQRIPTKAKGFHDQFPLFHLGEKIIPFFSGWGVLRIRHKPGAP